jgi:ATP-dependent DNA helicase RecQ
LKALNREPPYVIFHDATLLHMTNECPQTLEAMRGIAGIGERKLTQYGQAFLAVVLES